MTAVAVTLGMALLVGVSLGLLGGGGGAILTVPILTAVAGIAPRAAIASSLLIVGATSAVGLVQHARAGRVRWRIGALFAAAGAIGALLGGLLGRVCQSSGAGDGTLVACRGSSCSRMLSGR